MSDHQHEGQLQLVGSKRNKILHMLRSNTTTKMNMLQGKNSAFPTTEIYRSMCNFLKFTESGKGKHNALVITRDIRVINDLSRAPIPPNQQANSFVKSEHEAYRFSMLYPTEKRNQKSTSRKRVEKAKNTYPLPPSHLGLQLRQSKQQNKVIIQTEILPPLSLSFVSGR